MFRHLKPEGYSQLDRIVPWNMLFHFEISGKDNNDLHSPNIALILVTLLVFHFEISGKDNNDEHPPKIEFISLTF